MSSEKKVDTAIEDIERFLDDMIKENRGTVIQSEQNLVNNTYSDPIYLHAKLKLLRIYFKVEDGEMLYYIEDGALYSLGERTIATNPFSNSLIPIRSMDWLDKLIEYYEICNPGVQIEKRFIEYMFYMNSNYNAENLLTDYYDKVVKDYLKGKESSEITEEEINNLIDKSFTNIDYNKIRSDVLKRYKKELVYKDTNHKL